MTFQEQFHSLLNHLEVADILDERASTIRLWMEHDPARLPTPLRFEGSSLVRWPMDQIAAWIEAGTPRNYSREAAEFVPWAVANYGMVCDLASGGNAEKRQLIQLVYGEESDGL